MRNLFKSVLILLTIFAIAGLVFTANYKAKTASATTNEPNLTEGSLVKIINDPNIYVIKSDSKGMLKVWIRSINVFNSCGYDWTKVQTVASINYLPKTANLIKKADNPDVYRLEKDFKRKFRSAAVLDSYNLHWEDIATVCPAVLDSYSTAPLLADGIMIYKVGSDFVRHLYNNMATFYADGMSTKDIIDANDSEIYSYDSGAGMPNTTQPISCTEEGQQQGVDEALKGIQCCGGLTVVYDKCVDYQPEEGVCTYCGNGVCGTGENKCNCPADCK